MPGARPSTQSIITNAMRTLGVLGAADSAPGGEDNEFALSVYNGVLGQFNLRERKAYFMRHQSFTFTTARTSYTIGTSANSANFVVTAGDRPVKIERAQLVLVSTDPDTFWEVAVYNWPDYSLLTVPGLTSTYPFAIYYEPSVPNGVIYPYPTSPSETSNQLRLWWWNQLLTVAMADISSELDLPPGLERALTLRLAVALWLSFPKRTDLEELKRQERIAVADFESPNRPPPRISTTDGIQVPGGWSWRTRGDIQ